jgi:periplasmic divalent cation tolerance protein
MEYRSIYIIAKDEAEARRIGQILVQEKLIACVNYFPINSIYRWQGKVEENREIALIMKTRQEWVEPIIRRVKELHSYEVPCIESWKIESGLPEYLDWIQESTERN